MNYTIDLRRFRQKLGITQRQAATSIGIDQRQWSRYENGTNEFPIRYLVALCKAFQISADWILGLEDDPQTPA